MKICFLVWSPDISGGTNVIFEHATRLRKSGNEITIVTSEKVCKKRLQWFPGAEELSWKTYDEVNSEVFDLAIATWWRTVFFLKNVNANRYAYFVQSIESKFYPENEVILRNLVEQTYTLDLEIITEATWIKDYLQENYERNVHLVKNGIRKEYFNSEIQPVSERDKNKVRLLVEGPLGVSFKNTELAVELAQKSNVDEIWMLTSTEIAAYPKVDRLFSRVPISNVGEIYSSCDILLKLSTVEGMFGPPLEAYHCGSTSISYDVTGYDEYIVDGKNGLVSYSRTDDEVVELINSLVSDKDKLNSLKTEALETANSWPDWDMSSSEFEKACADILSNPVQEQSISKISVAADLMFGTYEHSLISSNSAQPKLSSIKFLIANKIHIKYPRLFSLLRKVKWTLVSLISRFKETA